MFGIGTATNLFHRFLSTRTSRFSRIFHKNLIGKLFAASMVWTAVSRNHCERANFTILTNLGIITAVECSNYNENVKSAGTKEVSISKLMVSLNFHHYVVPNTIQLIELLAKCMDIYNKHKEAIDALIERQTSLVHQCGGDNMKINLNFNERDAAITHEVIEFISKCIDAYEEHENTFNDTLDPILKRMDEKLEEFERRKWREIDVSSDELMFVIFLTTCLAIAYFNF